MPLHRRLPKRGFTNPSRLDYNEVNVGRVQQAVEAGKLAEGVVTVAALVQAGVVSKPRDGVKLLGMGELKVALTFEVAAASRSAVEAIEKAGGRVTVLIAPALVEAAAE